MRKVVCVVLVAHFCLELREPRNEDNRQKVNGATRHKTVHKHGGAFVAVRRLQRQQHHDSPAHMILFYFQFGGHLAGVLSEHETGGTHEKYPAATTRT